MEYITVKEASELWGTDVSTIGKLLRGGKIAGAARMGGHWVIPKGTPKPADGRTKEAQRAGEKRAAEFRFPLFADCPESERSDLSPEEARLCGAETDFFACDFEKALPVFSELSEGAESVYVKICAQFFMCLLSAVYDKSINSQQYYYRMNLLLSEDFPHRAEMELFLSLFELAMGRFASVSEKLRSDMLHACHPSALHLTALLSLFNVHRADRDTDVLQYLEPYELMSRMMERDGHFLTAQNLHMYMFIAYYSYHNEEKAQRHMKEALRLAYEHNLIYPVADTLFYYGEATERALAGYPADFVQRLRNAEQCIGRAFSRFAEELEGSGLYSRLSKEDFRFLAYAANGFSNKQTAEMCGLSERTVAKKYSDIYDKLGVLNKQELMQEINASLGLKG